MSAYAPVRGWHRDEAASAARNSEHTSGETRKQKEFKIRSNVGSGVGRQQNDPTGELPLKVRVEQGRDGSMVVTDRKVGCLQEEAVSQMRGTMSCFRVQVAPPFPTHRRAATPAASAGQAQWAGF